MSDNKVLVIHGYGQQAEEVKKKYGRTFKKIGFTNIDYIEAPLLVTNRKGEPGRGWFLWHDDNDDICACTKYVRVEESLQYLHDYIITHGPYKTIIGYSQGGTILSIALDRFPIEVRKVIIISSYDPVDPEWLTNHESKYDTLLVAGQRDETVPMKYTLSMYNNATVLIHNGTHSLPNTSNFITGVMQFLNTPK